MWELGKKESKKVIRNIKLQTFFTKRSNDWRILHNATFRVRTDAENKVQETNSAYAAYTNRRMHYVLYYCSGITKKTIYTCNSSLSSLYDFRTAIII